MKDLCLSAMNTAENLRVDYADIRIVQQRDQRVGMVDLSPKQLIDEDITGFGVRVLKNGAWGFASSSNINIDNVNASVNQALQIALASSSTKEGRGISLADEPPHKDCFKTPVKIDPFDIAINDKIQLLLEINKRILGIKYIVKAVSQIRVTKRHQFFASTEGSLIETDIWTVNAGYTAVSVKGGDSQNRSFQDYPLNAGWEHIQSMELLESAERIAEEAVMKIEADYPVEGRKDLVLDPSHLSLTIHESVGHPTELDRVLGYEANFAGRSFATTEKKGNFRYGSEIANFVADNTLPGGLATTGYDDEGVKCQRWDIIRDGILLNYSSTREVAPLIGEKRSKGSARADGYYNMPINRIPNLSLMPSPENVTPEDLIAGIEDGILIEGRGSFSIDQMRLNFQFGGDLFFEIKNGKKGKMLRDVIYQSITPEFWGGLDAVSGKEYWEPRGFRTCGKGEPMQIAQMTNGAPYARFRGVNVRRGRK
ncbi:TldD/PmbA family protein [candidate division WOR-3 bacterium]|nr:TldD/PmbA family protein [candidate division WOR-3 bacterium]